MTIQLYLIKKDYNFCAMSDDLISGDTFKTGVLGTLFAGVTLYGYKNFLAKRSYMVEYKAYVDDNVAESTIDVDNITEGTLVYQARPIFSKTHDDIVQNVYEHLTKNNPKFENVATEKIRVLIQRIHII